MSSERKLAANRSNARRSTGPRTAAGKSRASRNALRHGLAAMSLPAALPPSPEIERVARAICGSSASPWQYQQAVIIAEAEHILRMVRTARAAAIKRIARRLPPRRRDERAALHHALSDTAKYDRYERRALSRRRRAIRMLVASSILGLTAPAPPVVTTKV
jgi:hypothetical protein